MSIAKALSYARPIVHHGRDADAPRFLAFSFPSRDTSKFAQKADV
jgi:hypothetical protein